MALIQQKLALDVPFKGARNYLRFADILPALIEVVHERFGCEAQVASVTLRRPFHNEIEFSFEPSAAASGSFSVRHGSESIPGWLLETDRPVTRRVSFDSFPLSAAAISGPGFARILEPVPEHTQFDIVVGLIKLVTGQVDPRHWWLCQLSLDTPLTNSFPLEVRILHNLGGLFLVFEIVQRGVPIGSARGILEATNS
jgi:hypothetical protein